MIQRRPTVLLIACGLVVSALWGCGARSPEMREAASAVAAENYEGALASVNRALERDTVTADMYLFKANVLRRMADSTMTPKRYIALHRRAAVAEDSALTLRPGARRTVRNARRRVYDREVRRAESAYNRADKREEEPTFRRAIAFFGAAGATRPDSARPTLNEAFARLQVGQTQAVIPVLRRYVERADTARKAAYKILGELYVSTRQYEAAADLLDEATGVYPADRELQALRLDAYNRSGDVDEALAAYREQIERAPDAPGHRYNYGALLLKAERYTEAIRQLRRAVELRPDHAEGQYNLGAAYLNAALARTDSIATLRDTPADSLNETAAAVEAQITRLDRRREQLFEQAIPPLERARRLTQEQYVDVEGEETLRRDACRALLVAYTQTDRPNRAARVRGCTELARSGR
ncbi:MAG: tetratricopeptide repeat protein [Salinibacter sp.]